MPAESDQPRENLERSTEIIVTYSPKAIGKVRKVTMWVAGKAIDGTARAIQISGKAVQYAGKGVQVAGTGISAVGTGISSTLGAIPYVGIPFRFLGQGINGLGKGVNFLGKGIEGLGKGIESAGKGLERLKQGISNLGQTFKSIKNISQLGKVAGGPVGLAMLATNNPLVKKIAKGIAALIAYLLLKFGLKVLGAITGLGFGLVTGLPFLAFGPPGWAAYVAWTAYWTWYGWNNPIQMFKTVQTAIHYATHPWEIVTKPLAQGWGYAKGAFNTVTGGPISTAGGLPGVIGGFLSGLGNAIASGATIIWGGITGGAGAIWGGITGAVNFVVGAAGSISLPASVVAVPLGGALGGVALGTILTGITTNSSFFTPEKDAIIAGSGDTDFFTISKAAEKSRLSNSDLPAEIYFLIDLKAKSQKLTQIKIRDVLTVQGENANLKFEDLQKNCGLVPTELDTGKSWGCKIKFDAADSPDYRNSTIKNTITVTASPGGQPPITGTASATVTIGSPPTDCPSGWPTEHGDITVGPKGSAIHANTPNEAALDIAIDGGTPTYATFTGKVKDTFNEPPGGEDYGTYVEVEATCNGAYFYAIWAHLQYNSIDPAIKIGSKVEFGQLIGLVDSTGTSGGDHLHYAFFFLEMKEPYIPEAPPPTCNDFEKAKPQCNVSW